MFKLPKPLFDNVKQVVVISSSNYRNEDLRRRFRDAADMISTYSEKCGILMESGAYGLLDKNPCNMQVSAQEMKKLYRDKFQKRGQPGRRFYDAIIAAAPDKVCPYCGINFIDSLDHYLAKKHYPYLSVSPINLIPVCNRCNRLKGTDSCDESRRFLNPYFDACVEAEYLCAKIELEHSLPRVMYEIVHIEGMNEQDYRNAKNHFDSLQLDEVFCKQALEEVSNMRALYNGLPKKMSAVDTKKWLENMYFEYRSQNKRKWKTALYKEAYSNDEFIEWLTQ